MTVGSSGGSGSTKRNDVDARRWAIAVAAALVTLLAPAGAARADTIDVTTTSDLAAPGCPDGGGDCSLRQALAKAVAGDTIALPANPSPYAVSSALGQLEVTQAGVRITGAGARATTIDGGDATRLFDVTSAANLQLVDVTLTGGNGSGGGTTGQGGAARVLAGGTLVLQRVAVTGNAASGDPTSSVGGGLANAGSLTILDSQLSGNSAPSGSQVAIATGGAINNTASLTVSNSTISGNSAGGGIVLGRGGAVYTAAGATSTIFNSTLATNGAGAAGQGGNLNTQSGGTTFLANSLIAEGIATGASANCGGSAPVSAGHNLDTGTTCGLGGTGDKSSTDPLLGGLADNGGSTDTRALATGSPAVDAVGGAPCPATDQRGMFRPQGPACDIGAFELEYPAPPPEIPPAGSPSAPPSGDASAVLGVSFNLSNVGGVVKYKLPDTDEFVDLPGSKTVPLRTTVDSRFGTGRVVTASNATGGTQSGQFSGGVFQVYQTFPSAAAARAAATLPAPITDLLLRGGDFSGCPRYKSDTLGVAVPSASGKKTVRKLFSNAKGRFRTRGRYSSAVVRGTQWTTEDRCDGTLTSVTSGLVEVFDSELRKSISLGSGKSYLAKPRECVSRRRFRIQLRNPVKGTEIVSAVVTINGRRTRTLRGSRIRAGVDLRGLPKGAVTVRIRARLSNGRVLTGVRRYLTCSREPRETSGLPLL